MDNHSEYGSEDNSTTKQNARLIVTHEGLLDTALLKRTEGYMYKKGGAVNARGGFRNWKKRWFVISPVEILGAQGYELQYYDSQGGNLKGKVGLSEIEVLCEEKSSHKNVKHEFQIGLQNGGVLELSCDDAGERDEWMETLNMITAYLKKVLTSTAMTLDGYDPNEEDDEASYNIGHEIALNCQAFGPGLFGAEAGTQSQFVVQVHDLVGQQVTKGGMPITATLSNADCLYYLRVIDNDDGTYFCQYMLGRAGKYQLSVRLNDEHEIFGSPFAVEILPSRTLARYCTADGDALSGIMANQTQTFTIIAMDGFGNRKINGGDPFEVGVMGPAQLRALTDNADGSYTCTIAAASPASAAYVTSSSLMIQVTLHGKAIAGSPFKPIITEDLRGLYAASTNARSSGAVSMASAMTSPAGSTLQSPNPGRHAMAQQQPASVYSGRSVNGNSNNGNSNSSTLDNLLNELDLEGDASVRSVSAAMAEQPAARSSNSSVAGSRSPPPPPPPSSRAAPPAPHTPPPQNSSASVASASRSVATAGNKSNATPAAVNARQNSNTPAAAAAPAPAPAAATPGGGGLSRLERSRQRALLAKALADSSPAPAPVSATATAGASPLAPSTGAAADAAGEYAGGRKPSKLEELQRSMASNSSTPAQQQQKAASSAQQQQRTVSAEFLGSVVSSLQQGLGGSGSGAGGISPGYPANATQNEIKIWDHTQKAFQNEEVIRLLCSNLEVLRTVYETFADFVEGVQVIKLTTSGSNQQGQGQGQGGLYRLLELYDVTPTYLSKVEAKVLFTLTLHAQRNLRSPAAVAGGGTGLDFVCFLKFLVMIAYHALSKTNSFSSMYSTIESKVEVLLFKWALADPLKLQVVTTALRTAVSSASMVGSTSSMGGF